MNIILFNSEYSLESIANEALTLPAYLLMADTVHYDSKISFIMKICEHLDQCSNDLIVDLHQQNYQDDEEELARIAEFRRSLLKYNEVKKYKHKDKKELHLISFVSKTFKNLRTLVKLDYEVKMEEYNLLELIPFYRNGKLLLDYGSYEDYEGEENKYLTRIADQLIERKAMFALSVNVQNIFSFQTLKSDNPKDCSFLKVPLWQFPFISNTPYDHINYTREQLKPVFQPFKDNLKELQNEFFNMEFTTENIPLFKQKTEEKIVSHISPIQKEIDECIYISNIRNAGPINNDIRLCLGIAPLEAIVNYYQSFNIIVPYEATEIKQRISRHMNLNSTCIFTYFEASDQTS